MIVNFPGQGKAFFREFFLKCNSEEIIAGVGAACRSGLAHPRLRGA
jgi:hypothetical protein